MIAFRIALITPKAAEGSLDFQRILLREQARAPTIVNVYHATFQSEFAAQEIPSALNRAIAGKPDLIVVVRGGGSKADLLYLNSYPIGRAICECPIPVWTGIGHSTDKTLVDEVANQVFKTPSDAAHAIVNMAYEAISKVGQYGQDISQVTKAIAERFDRQLQRDLDEVSRCLIATVEKVTNKANELASNSSHCGRIVIANSVRHLDHRATASIASSKLVQERWNSVVSNQHAAASRAAEAVIRNLLTKTTILFDTCDDNSQSALSNLESAAARLNLTTKKSTELCCKRVDETVREALLEPKKMLAKVLDRASSDTHRVVDNVLSLVSVKVKSVQVEARQRLTLSSELSRSMVGKFKLVMNGDFGLTRRYVDMTLVRSQGAVDKLGATIESADFRGPLKRGFVMVTDENERWLRAAVDTIEKMRLIFKDGVVQVRKDEPGL
jgi:exodeoxyribonuclease VII large subunit